MAFWIVFCAFCNGAGWILSGVHALSRAGYALAFGAGAVALVVWRVRARKPLMSPPRWTGLRRRFARPLALAFLAVAALAIFGGALHSPGNYDAMTYRLPRVLHWLAEGQWHWIHTPDARMNTRASGFEWASAPLLVLTRSDRLFFLLNAVSFLLLPGLIFSVFTRLGVARRAAGHWMWVLPAGFCYVLQAGSVANDLFGVVFALAALDYALRAGESGRGSELGLSLLAAALMTGAKGSNLPLLLPWLAAFAFAFRRARARPAVLAVVLLAAGLSSFLPQALLNFRHCGDWTGAVLEPARYRIHRPLVGMVGNTLTLGLDNLSLPVMPLPRATGEKLARSLLPEKVLKACDENFHNPFGAFWGSGIQTEDGAGVGFGLSALLAGSLAAGWYCRGRGSAGRESRGPSGALSRGRRLVLAGCIWVAVIVYLANAGMGQVARLLAPYYPLLMPLVLIGPAQGGVVRRRWWRAGAALVFLMAASLLVVSPARPLFPAQSLLKRWKEHNAFLARSEASYAGHAQRYDGLGPVRSLLPPAETVIGFVSHGNDIEPSLWRPLGRRRVEYVLPTDTLADVRRRGIRYVVVGGETLAERGQTINDWLEAYRAESVGQLSLRRTFPPYVPVDWHVARLRP